MDAELAALAASGATTLVGLMVSDAWTQTRGRVAGFFARDGGDRPADEPERVERWQAEQLQESQEQLAAAHASQDEATAADIEQEWKSRLRRLLRNDPTAADELRLLLDELRPHVPQVPQPSVANVHNTMRDVKVQAPVIQAMNVSGVGFAGPGSPPAGEERS